MKTTRFIHLMFYMMITFGNLSDLLAQNNPKRFAFELNAGMPIPLASIPASFAGYFGAGLRYNVTTALSLQGSANYGSMRGARKGQMPSFQNPERVENYSDFTTNFISYMFRGQLNMERVLRLRQYDAFKRINPYITGGLGYTVIGENDIEAARFQLPSKMYGNLNFYTLQTGLLLRYYLNPSLDLNIGCEFNFTQTYYLDGIFADQKYDHYMLNYIGINFKLGATNRKQHIEWYNLRFFERKPRKQPTDNDVEPVIPVFAKNIELDTAVSKQLNIDSSLANKDSLIIDNSIASNRNIQHDGKDTSVVSIEKLPTTEKKPSQTETQTKLEVNPPKPTTAPIVAIDTNKDSKNGLNMQDGSIKIKKPELVKTEVTKSPVSSIQKESTPKTALIVADQKNTGTHHLTNKEHKDSKLAKASTPNVFKVEPVVITNAQTDKNSPTLNFIENVASQTPVTYTVIVGAFSKQKISYAYKYRNRLRNQGYQAALVQSDRNPNIVRIMVYSTKNKGIALQQCLKARNEIDSKAWIHRSVR